MKTICIIIMTICLSFISTSHYVNRMFQSEYIDQAIDQLDLMPMVESRLGEEYEKILDKLIETEEFQKIVYDYAKAFAHYLYNGEGVYIISDEVESNLFKQYSSSFLDQYPQLSFMPTDLLIEFLVERIDLNSYLPSFEQLEKEIPNEVFLFIYLFKSTEIKNKVILTFIISFILYMLLSKKITLLPLIISLISTIIFLVIIYQGYIPLPFSNFENALITLIRELQVEIKYCIMTLVGCLGLEWGLYYAKKIFLF